MNEEIKVKNFRAIVTDDFKKASILLRKILIGKSEEVGSIIFNSILLKSEAKKFTDEDNYDDFIEYTYVQESVVFLLHLIQELIGIEKTVQNTSNIITILLKELYGIIKDNTEDGRKSADRLLEEVQSHIPIMVEKIKKRHFDMEHSESVDG